VLSGRLGAEGMPPAWVMLVSRTVGVTIIVLPLVLTRRFRLTRAAAPLVVLAGVLEVFGGAVYVVAASEGVAVAAVLSSQFAAIAAVGAFFLFRERMQRMQVAGVALIALGITMLAAFQA
jgi:drug/metabolite transporter (DMT)-like permease